MEKAENHETAGSVELAAVDSFLEAFEAAVEVAEGVVDIMTFAVLAGLKAIDFDFEMFRINQERDRHGKSGKP